MTTFRLNIAALGIVAARCGHVVEAAAVIAQDAVVETMDPGPERTGLMYPVPGTKVPYQSSAPGEPPAVREGIYRDSWKFTPAVREGDVIRARAYTDRLTEDGKYVLGELLEYGTQKMLPRPHVRPALEQAAPAVAQLVRDASA